MNTTDVIARSGHSGHPFPQNILWRFHPDDERRLRHMPDMWVRPGGIRFGEDYSIAPFAADDLIEQPEGVSLEVRPVETLLPLGAPARVDVSLVNGSARPVPVPSTLSLRGGAVRGKVIDSSGTVRAFLPLVACVDEQPLRRLEPDEHVAHPATLTHGPQGALFPSPGLYRIVVEVTWDDGGATHGLTGSATLLVAGATSSDHQTAAHGILSNSCAALAIAASIDVGGGVSAIERAGSDETLGAHYAWLDAKRRLRAPATTGAGLRQALQRLAEEPVVMSAAECRRALETLDDVEARSTTGDMTPRLRSGTAGPGEAADAPPLRDLFQAARRRVEERAAVMTDGGPAGGYRPNGADVP